MSRVLTASAWVALLPVCGAIWIGMAVSTVCTAAGTAVFFDGLDAQAAALERDRPVAAR